MAHTEDNAILFNVAKVIAVLVGIMFSLIIVAGYIGGTG